MSHPCCNICLEEFNTTFYTEPWVLHCGHCFCRECLMRLSPPQACPTCRQGFTGNQLAANRDLMDMLDSTVTPLEMKIAKSCKTCIGERDALADAWYCLTCFQNQGVGNEPEIYCGRCNTCVHDTPAPLVKWSDYLVVDHLILTDHKLRNAKADILKKSETLVERAKKVAKELSKRVNSLQHPVDMSDNAEHVRRASTLIEDHLKKLNSQMAAMTTLCEIVSEEDNRQRREETDAQAAGSQANNA